MADEHEDVGTTDGKEVKKLTDIMKEARRTDLDQLRLKNPSFVDAYGADDESATKHSSNTNKPKRCTTHRCHQERESYRGRRRISIIPQEGRAHYASGIFLAGVAVALARFIHHNHGPKWLQINNNEIALLVFHLVKNKASDEQTCVAIETYLTGKRTIETYLARERGIYPLPHDARYVDDCSAVTTKPATGDASGHKRRMVQQQEREDRQPIEMEVERDVVKFEEFESYCVTECTNANVPMDTVNPKAETDAWKDPLPEPPPLRSSTRVISDEKAIDLLRPFENSFFKGNGDSARFVHGLDTLIEARSDL
jgi:hypothetical protein